MSNVTFVICRKFEL